jgi:hypothetical protein
MRRASVEMERMSKKNRKREVTKRRVLQVPAAQHEENHQIKTAKRKKKWSCPPGGRIREKKEKIQKNSKRKSQKRIAKKLTRRKKPWGKERLGEYTSVTEGEYRGEGIDTKEKMVQKGRGECCIKKQRGVSSRVACPFRME